MRGHSGGGRRQRIAAKAGRGERQELAVARGVAEAEVRAPSCAGGAAARRGARSRYCSCASA